MNRASAPALAAAGAEDDREVPFGALAAGVVRAFDLDYAHLKPPEGGDLYVTRHGWPHRAELMPGRWYADQWYERHGVKLRGATGTVYHVRPRPAPGGGAPALDLVVKFSRVAQDVPLIVDTRFPAELSPEIIAAARFNSPMEEFGLLGELRRAVAPGPRILTQRPLAIYAPPEEFDLWQLGRQTSSFHSHRVLLAEDQADAVKAIELDIKRIYVVLYGWIDGEDADQCRAAGLIDAAELKALTVHVNRELEARGFLVLDHKPQHFVLRRRPGGLLRRKDGSLVYGLVDYELLQRTPAHQQRWKSGRSERYWRLQAARPASGALAAPPAALRAANVFGVEYVFGPTPDGGRLWVVGREPELFDYFLPERWRRTPREKISVGGEVYRARSRDQVDIVYRRSRVGLVPRADPLSPAGRRIREAGTNSPFEEVALAQRLRDLGIPTVHPRAIYETGHETVKAFRLRDPRRFAEHQGVMAPEDPPRPALRPDHDYYTVWDTYRGAMPGAPGAIGLEPARDGGLVEAAEAEEALARARRALARTALPPEAVAADEFMIAVDGAGAPRRDGAGLRLFFSLDALIAFDHGLLGEAEYLEVMRWIERRLQAVDFEKLDPNGRHLLLTVDSEARVLREPGGDPYVVLCNFALIRGLYRPIR